MGNGWEMDGKWMGSGREVDGKWTGSGREVDGKWTGSGWEVDGKWMGSGAPDWKHVDRSGGGRQKKDINGFNAVYAERFSGLCGRGGTCTITPCSQ
jgi:hypothetical protein